LFIQLREILIRFAAQNSGTVRLDCFIDDSLKFTKSLSMSALKSGETSRRHRFGCDAVGDLIVLELRNSSRQEKMVAYEIGMTTYLWEQR